MPSKQTFAPSLFVFNSKYLVNTYTTGSPGQRELATYDRMFNEGDHNKYTNSARVQAIT